MKRRLDAARDLPAYRGEDSVLRRISLDQYSEDRKTHSDTRGSYTSGSHSSDGCVCCRQPIGLVGLPGERDRAFWEKMLLSASVHNGDFERHPWDKQRVGCPERNSPCHWDTAVGDSTYEKPAEGKPRISFSASEFQLTRLHPTSTRYQYALVLAYNGSDRELTICAVSRSHCWR